MGVEHEQRNTAISLMRKHDVAACVPLTRQRGRVAAHSRAVLDHSLYPDNQTYAAAGAKACACGKAPASSGVTELARSAYGMVASHACADAALNVWRIE